ncbi:hypothetical protein [Streptodolium elevatio]|uniref:Uncharacterized protein n=1 Tax=Streptodolium elevatio TaxID=3157996 RepID=A0ABV3DCR7_9ACTN
MTEIETTPKKAGRKPDPMTRILNDLKAAIKGLGEYESKSYGEARRHVHDGRAFAWAREYERTGTFDALLLAHTFGALCESDDRQRQRDVLLDVAAVAIAKIEKLDGGQ